MLPELDWFCQSVRKLTKSLVGVETVPLHVRAGKGHMNPKDSGKLLKEIRYCQSSLSSGLWELVTSCGFLLEEWWDKATGAGVVET